MEKVASRVARRMPAWIEMDELIALGNVGLVEAAGRFDPELHASFRVFAMLRVRGAMIDAFRGRNYPRLMEAMPEAWLQGSNDDDEAHSMSRTPDALIESNSILEMIILQEESVVVSIDAVRARSKLKAVEGKVLDLHVSGLRMADIGKRHRKSAAWARYTVFSAKQKLRAALLVDEKEAA